MTPAEFDARLHELLDARRDPLDDPACRAHLDGHPEALARFASLREHLAVLCELAPLPVERAPRHLTPWLLVAVAAAAALWLAWPAAAARAAPAEAAPRGRILAASLVPIRPTLGLAGMARARTVLVDQRNARLEAFTHWSAP